jgi:hypothetical protein
MSFIARREASQVNDKRLILAVTTTVFTYPTTTDTISQNAGEPVPVGAIVGGVVAGILLAVIVAVGWIYWGKSIRRTVARQQSEAVSSRFQAHNEVYLLTFHLAGGISQNEIQHTA